MSEANQAHLTLDVIATLHPQRLCCRAFAHSLPARSPGQHLQQHSRHDHAGLAPRSDSGAGTAFEFHAIVSSGTHHFLFQQARREVRLRHSLSGKGVHVSELQVRLADPAERQDLRSARHDASGIISVAAERLSSCAAYMMLLRRTSNQSLEPTADRRMKG
jgi:hypothetical protein